MHVLISIDSNNRDFVGQQRRPTVGDKVDGEQQGSAIHRKIAG